MKVPYSWLKDFVDITISPEELGEKLVSAGFEIEEIIYNRDAIKNVVTGKILSVTKHKNSDHLSVCSIDIGKDKPLQIVTGASNVKAGDIIPVALDNSILPNGKKIFAGELRGVLSEGMLCSGGELEITEDDFVGAGVNGIWILPTNTAIGVDINDIIGNNEVILDVAITANRPDCNSIFGIAREVSAVLKLPLKAPDFSYSENKESIKNYVSIENKNYSLCPRYLGKAVRNIKIEKSPKIIRDRLRAVGIRAINNYVDITNYVLIEIGQPMHAFDLDILDGKKIVIRNANEGEKILALDGKEYSLNANMLAICDNNKPVAIAGVMGGEECSINDNTKNVVLESARFARDSVRHTSRDLNLHSDSSTRFEKGIDFYSQEAGLKRALALLYKYNWGEIVGGEIDIIKEKPTKRCLTYNYQEINKIIGVEIDKNSIINILKSLTLDTTANGDILTTFVPDYREDIYGINDLTEEVIRIYGYNVVVPRLVSNKKGGKTDVQLRMDKLKNILTAKGAFEIYSYSFVPPKAFDMLNLSEVSDLRKAIALKNPLSVDISIMRTTLSYSMLKIMSSNYARGNKNFRLFEIANIYEPKKLPLEDLPYEHTMLSIGLIGDEDFYKLKAIVEDILNVLGLKACYQRTNISYLHPGRAASVICNDVCIGYIGEVHVDVANNFDVDKKMYIAELDAEFLVKNGIDIKPYKAVSKYQAVERDLALIAPLEMPAQTILDTVNAAASNILESSEVFDVYTGGQVPKDKKSVAIKIIFRDFEKTLKDSDVNAEIEKILGALEKIYVFLR